MTNWEKAFDILVGDGRGRYQKDDLLAVVQSSAEAYERSRGQDMSVFNLALFADVGTGKTPASIRYIVAVREYLHSQNDPRAKKPVLVITPATVKFNWLSEIRTWANPGPADVWVIDGRPEQRAEQLRFVELLKPKWVIINYDLVRIHEQELQDLTPRGQEDDPFFLSIICDEVHYIKWRSAARTRAVGAIVGEFHVGLTGTPQSNKPDSLWNVVTWTDNPPTRWRTTPAVPPRPKSNCPLPDWRRKKFEQYSKGCAACSNWMPRAERCRASGRRKCWKDGKPARPRRIRGESRFWGREWAFKDRYCEMETIHLRSRDVTRVVGPKISAMHDLNRRLKEWGMVRWRRAEVLNMRDLVYERVMLQATPQQENLYAQLANGMIQLYDDNWHPSDVKEVRSVLAKLTYFRRATTLTPREFSMALQGRNPEFAPTLKVPVSDSGAKQDWLMEFMESEFDQDYRVKFIIQSEWPTMLRPLLKRLASKFKFGEFGNDRGDGGTVSIIDGSTPKKQRQAISEGWNSDLDFKVLLGSGAIFEGINLQGGLGPDDVVYVIVMNLTWMPSQVVQWIGRAWRFGQDAQVVAMFPTVSGSIDEYMANTLLGKQLAFDTAIDGGEHNMANLFGVTSGRDVLDLIGTLGRN